MSFVSTAFPIFLTVVFVLYYAFPALRLQNILIAVSSYVFYGWWDVRFVPLLLGISLANYISAILIENTTSRARAKNYLIIALSVSIVALAFFKYFNFFVGSAAELGKIFGYANPAPSLHIILPLGISFMTFQGMAYVIDVWRGDHVAERDIVRFLAFKAFFPQLVAGPIERASNLLDQFGRHRSIDKTKINRAVWLIIYGYAMKIVVADSLAPIVDSLFVKNQPYGWSVVLGTIAFGIQVYADFCGYSLIAKGVALLFGFDLIWNFRFPYWAASISDFWRRWHVSLSRWLRDYLYIPLGGNRSGSFATARNLLITMGFGGLWHGAAWNFVLWGLLHGVALAAWRFAPVSSAPASAAGKLAGWAATILIVFVGWFFFRATSLELLLGMAGGLGNWAWAPVHSGVLLALAAVIAPLTVLEWLLQKRGDFFLPDGYRALSYVVYSVLTPLILAMAGHHQVSFIYFQF